MMIVRLISYFFCLFLFTSVLSMSSVCWSFYESVRSSFNLIKYSSDNKARDILATVARVAESKMDQDGYVEMSELFLRMIKQSEKDLDRFTIKDVFLISTEGTVLAHSNSKELSDNQKSNTKYNKPYYMRALRMRKGQPPTPQIFGQEEYKGDNGFVSNQILKLFPELKYQQILLSAPIYHTEKLETIGSIHLIYNRGNVLFFIENQKEIFFWMFWNYLGISFIVTCILFSIYAFFLFGAYKQAVRRTASIPEPELPETVTKIINYVSKHEENITRYLTPVSLKAENTLINAASLTQMMDESIHPENISSANFKKIDLNLTNSQIEPIKKDKNATEAIDAIYLD